MASTGWLRFLRDPFLIALNAAPFIFCCDSVQLFLACPGLMYAFVQ